MDFKIQERLREMSTVLSDAVSKISGATQGKSGSRRSRDDGAEADDEDENENEDEDEEEDIAQILPRRKGAPKARDANLNDLHVSDWRNLRTAFLPEILIR